MRERFAGAPGLRTGFTTGACAAAAARAAARYALSGEAPRSVEITLPNGKPATFAIARAARGTGAGAVCAVVKDGGDDPDATHGAEIVVEVEPLDAPGIELRGGAGVATVTRPGLGLAIGAPAINPVPRRNIAAMVEAELSAFGRAGARVTVSVPRGEEIARATLNARLGLVGGISILGTTGVVRPFSTRAWQASVAAAIDVACAAGIGPLVFTTGGRTEAYAMRLHPGLAEAAFVQVGDGVGAALRHASRRGAAAVELVAMVGKLSKLAAGALAVHAADAEVDLALLARVTAEAGGAAPLCARVGAANTAREALELWSAAGIAPAAAAGLCARAARRCADAARGVDVGVALVGFDGGLLGRAGGRTP